jgi:hypothetical protein
MSQVGRERMTLFDFISPSSPVTFFKHRAFFHLADPSHLENKSPMAWEACAIQKKKGQFF